MLKGKVRISFLFFTRGSCVDHTHARACVDDDDDEDDDDDDDDDDDNDDDNDDDDEDDDDDHHLYRHQNHSNDDDACRLTVLIAVVAWVYICRSSTLLHSR